MRQKPLILIILSIVHLLAPVGNLYITAYRQNITVDYLLTAWMTTYPTYNFTVYMLVPLLSGIFIFLCKKWSLIGYLICMLVTVVTSLLGFNGYKDLTSVVAFSASIIVDIAIVVYFMMPEVRRVYLDPRLRWWESKPRYKFENPIKIIGIGEGRISNISIGGLLLFSQHILEDHQLVELEFIYGKLIFHIKGKVIYHRQLDEMGYGIQFDQQEKKNENLKNLILYLNNKDMGLQPRGLSKMTFFSWLTRLLKTGKGFFPEK